MSTQPRPARHVRCPACSGPALYAPENRWRPFCSQRCRERDLGAWAAEDYRVAADPVPDDTDSPPADPGRPGGPLPN